jgi:hypothetical protein
MIDSDGFTKQTHARLSAPELSFIIAALSWMNYGQETRFLKETGFLSTSQYLTKDEKRYIT